jgi:hypothetical protein
LNSIPAASKLPTHSIALAVLKTPNRNHPIRMAPASGGAMIASPGMNFAITKELTPHLSKRDCV